MKILFVGQEPWYEEMVQEIEKNNTVDYLFLGDTFKIANGRFQIPRVFGFRRGFIALSYLIVNCLLFAKKYDVCITDANGFPFCWEAMARREIKADPSVLD